MNDRLDRIEGLTAGILSAAAVWLHCMASVTAGPLWRDEANTVGLVTLPSLGDVWSNLQYDSFPMLWMVFVRQLVAFFGPMNDTAFRMTGLAIGLSIVVALWIASRTFSGRYPLIALALFSLNPSVIRWGDSLRAYGAGILFAFITTILLFRFLSVRSGGRFAATLLFALISVHTLYYNAVVLVALCAGAMVVCAIRRDSRAGVAVLGIGVLAGLSMFPYASTIQQAGTWNSLVQIPDYDVAWFLAKLNETLSTAGDWATPVWIVGFFLAAWAGIRETLQPTRLGLTGSQRESAAFGVTFLLCGAIASIVFLRILSYVTQPWYYLTLVATAALGMEIIASALVVNSLSRKLRLVVVAVIAAATLYNAPGQVRVRMTNADIVGRMLRDRATRGDLIVSNPWYFGVSVSRYYRGTVPSITIPTIGFTRFQRYDLLKLSMLEASQREPVESVLAAVKASLESGHSVFIIGDFPAAPLRPEIPLPAARLPDEGWKAPQYQRQWADMVAVFLKSHAITELRIPVATHQRVSEYENLGVVVATGWRE